MQTSLWFVFVLVLVERDGFVAAAGYALPGVKTGLSAICVAVRVCPVASVKEKGGRLFLLFSFPPFSQSVAILAQAILAQVFGPLGMRRQLATLHR